tara:strand:+ start:338 stop:940 length:603 start_codon:yes stop_codon:yes gene_type:complete
MFLNFKISIIILFYFIFNSFSVFSQINKDSLEIYKFYIQEGDTFISSTINNVIVSDYENQNDKREYKKIKKKVKRVYPYYLMTLDQYNKVNDTLVFFDKKRKQKKYIKNIEREMKNEYMDDLKSLKISEGRILIKLINRDTKQSAYDIIKSFRGGFSAFFWQSLAKVYDNDLKTIYNPDNNKEDKMIEKALNDLKYKNIK